MPDRLIVEAGLQDWEERQPCGSIELLWRGCGGLHGLAEGHSLCVLHLGEAISAEGLPTRG